MPVTPGRIGIWTNALDHQPARVAQEAVAELESLGYTAVWFPESFRREAMVNAALLLSGSEKIVVASGIANLHARDAVAMANGARSLAEWFPGRFMLGIGVSHQPTVEDMRGGTYHKPVATMTAYLDAMEAAPFQSPAPPDGEPTVVLAALGPRMLELAAARAAGAHPYFVPPEHTSWARSVLGGKLLAPEQAVCLETDAITARRIARRHMAVYLALPNYTRNLIRLGFGEDDLAGGGSDRLVDAIVAWGTVDQVASRVSDHLAAGADHVCIQALEDDATAPPWRSWRSLAGALT